MVGYERKYNLPPLQVVRYEGKYNLHFLQVVGYEGTLLKRFFACNVYKHKCPAMPVEFFNSIKKPDFWIFLFLKCYFPGPPEQILAHSVQPFGQL